MSKIQKLQKRIAGFTINMLMLLQLNYVNPLGKLYTNAHSQKRWFVLCIEI